MKLTRRVLEFAKGHQAEKTMVYVHYLDPHAPYEPPQDKYLRFADHVYPHPLNLGDQVRPCIPELVAGGFGPGEERFEDLMLRYDGEIADTDEAVQQLLEGLKALALLDDTLVILTADHGEEFLDHGYVEHAWRLYEESVHVPLLFWSPRFFKPARIPDRVSLADLLPTLLELARVSHQRNDFSGTAFFRGDGGPPVFTAPGKPIIAELLIETRSIVRTVTDGDFKYVAAQRWLTPAECSEAAKVQSEKVAELRSGKAPAFDDWGPVVFEELFNLKEDPFEQHPILEGHADQRAALQKILTDYRAACLAPAPSGKTPEAPRPGLKSGSTSLTPDQETQMKALGYF
jgi:arylsulfatase A-like enzyme